MAMVNKNKTSYNANIISSLDNFRNEIAREKLFFHVFWTAVLFPENIETNYILILPLKKLKSPKLLPIILCNID